MTVPLLTLMNLMVLLNDTTARLLLQLAQC